MFAKSKGTLVYSLNPYRLVVNVCQDLSDYYRRQIPKYIPVKGQRYQAHISVIRKEIPKNLEAWNKYRGQEVEFEYEMFPYNSDTYWWLNCWSSKLEDIRVELGLPAASRVTRSPDGRHRFHCTIGNTKPDPAPKKE